MEETGSITADWEGLKRMLKESSAWEGLKRTSKEFFDAAPTLNREELEQAWKCFGIAYLNFEDPMWQHWPAFLTSRKQVYLHFVEGPSASTKAY